MVTLGKTGIIPSTKLVELVSFKLYAAKWCVGWLSTAGTSYSIIKRATTYVVVLLFVIEVVMSCNSQHYSLEFVTRALVRTSTGLL